MSFKIEKRGKEYIVKNILTGKIYKEKTKKEAIKTKKLLSTTPHKGQSQKQTQKVIVNIDNTKKRQRTGMTQRQKTQSFNQQSILPLMRIQQSTPPSALEIANQVMLLNRINEKPKLNLYDEIYKQNQLDKIKEEFIQKYEKEKTSKQEEAVKVIEGEDVFTPRVIDGATIEQLLRGYYGLTKGGNPRRKPTGNQEKAIKEERERREDL